MKDYARVVVVGGGIVGVSTLYALARHGCGDAVLLERRKLTAGSTWHAAGLLVTYAQSYNVGRLAQETIDIYARVEQEVGSSVGFHRCGQLRVANTTERMDEFVSYIGTSKPMGIEAHIVTPAEIAKLHPLLSQNAAVKGGLYHPNDGHIAPSDITMAMAKLARQGGATIYQDTEALEYVQLPDRTWRVTTPAGTIVCEHLVFATGNYARENAKRVGLELPTIPIVHQYWLTEPIQALVERHRAGLPETPILRDEDFCGYLREDTNGLQFGPYEFTRDLKLFAVDGVPKTFEADLLPEDLPAVEHQWDKAIERIPVLGEAGLRANVRGPFQMTPDELPLCGPAPGLRNLWLAEGVPGGILWGGTMGEHLAQWILTGEPGADLCELDPRRFGPYVNKAWTADKVRDTWGTHMEVHVPGEDRLAARPAKTPPAYDFLTARGAVWGVMNGWEMPRWFAPSVEEAVPEFSYRHTKHMRFVAEEVKAVREAAGLNDITPMTKFSVSGPGAAAWLSSILTNRLPKPGRLGLTYRCTAHGGVISEYTLSCLDHDNYYLVSTPTRQVYNWDDLSRLLPGDGSVTMRDITETLGICTITGPRSREILQQLTDIDLSNEAFPWLSIRAGDVGYAHGVRLLRVNYTGELGWELHHPMAYQRHIVSELLRVGQPMGLRLFGLEALESMRLDKSYRAIRTELNTEIGALEAGLDRFVDFKKAAFIGREALLRQRDDLKRRMVTIKLPGSDTSVQSHQGVWAGDALVGRITSGGYSYHFQCDIALALVDTTHTAVDTAVEVMVHGEMRKGAIVQDSPYDPANERCRM